MNIPIFKKDTKELLIKPRGEEEIPVEIKPTLTIIEATCNTVVLNIDYSYEFTEF